jgi:hypothetical protein
VEYESRFERFPDEQRRTSETDVNWLNFLNTTVKFQELKEKTVFFPLNEEWSREYLSDRAFRSLIHSLTKKPRNQISLYFSYAFPSKSYYKWFDQEKLCDSRSVHSIELSNRKDREYL